MRFVLLLGRWTSLCTPFHRLCLAYNRIFRCPDCLNRLWRRFFCTVRRQYPKLVVILPPLIHPTKKLPTKIKQSQNILNFPPIVPTIVYVFLIFHVILSTYHPFFVFICLFRAQILTFSTKQTVLPTVRG